MQNNLARVVCNSSRLTPAEPLLRSLHWLPVRQRINYKLANLCYLAISRHQPVYLAHLIRPYSQSRLLRSSTQSLLSVPPHNIDIAARRFSVAAPRLWNCLPLSCRTAPSVNVFKNRHSFSVCDSDIVMSMSMSMSTVDFYSASPHPPLMRYMQSVFSE